MRAFARAAWPALRSAILDGLRKSPDPIRTSDVAAWCNVSHLMNTEEVRECLDQLEMKGLVRFTRLGWEAASRWGGDS